MKHSRFFIARNASDGIRAPPLNRAPPLQFSRPRRPPGLMRQKPVRSQPFRRGADYHHAQVVLEAPNEFAKPGFTVRTGTMQVSYGCE